MFLRKYMKTIPLHNLFTIRYWNQLDLNKMNIISSWGISFVSRTSQNLWVSSHVEEVDEIEPFPSWLITVSLWWTYLLSSFVQQKPFYTGQNIKVLEPKRVMSEYEKMYYCMIIESNRFRYTTHWREANQTLDFLLVPEYPHLDLEKIDIPKPSNQSLSPQKLTLNTASRKPFRYDEIFDIQKWYYNKKPEETIWGEVPFVWATEYNNGITDYCMIYDIENTQKAEWSWFDELDKKIFPPQAITVSNDWSIWYAFYQTRDFTCSHSVTPLYLEKKRNKTISPYLAMFLITLIEKEQYRRAYGRKRRPSRMPDSIIKLPVTASWTPDRDWMEQYIQSLPYSASLW